MDNGRICVLQFPIKDTKGGITQYVLGNWKFIDKRNFQFDFATMSPSLSFEDDLQREGCRVHHIKHYAEENPQLFYDEFKELFQDGRIDLVHLHTGRWKSQVAEQAIKDCGIRRMVIHAHSTGFLNVNGKEYKKELAQHKKVLADLHADMATDYWACSWPAAEFLFGDRIPKELIRIMPNAIDIERFSYDAFLRQKVRAEWQTTDRFVLGHVGRFAYPKNQIFLLRLMKKIIVQEPTACLILIGDGQDMSACQEFVKANGLTDCVICTGYRNDTERLLQSFDIFVFPSLYEGLGLALVEAQAAGLYCIASEGVPLEAKVTPDVEFLPLDEELWCERILKLIHRGYVRYNNVNAIQKAGYDIRTQITMVEKGYRGEL